MTVHGAPEYLKVGDHQILARLGEGGQGTVYLGQAPGRAQVAIKVLHRRLAADPETRRRFLREAEVAGRVAPFCTAKVLGTGLVDGRPYIISEYVPGPSLDELVKRDGPRTGSGLERLAVATLTALASIHDAGIVHRDVKPSNVILGPEGPVVIDFGIARVLDHMTTNSLVAGTPSYMSPEQFTDQRLTPASDMFSWAGMMIFAATGRPPFRASTVPAVLHAIMSGQANLAGVPERLLPLVIACLAKDPAARPAAGGLLRELTGGDRSRVPSGPPVAGGQPGGHTLVDAPGARAGARSDRDVTSTDESRPVRRRSPGMWIAVAAVGAILLVTAGVLVVPSWLGTPAGPVPKAEAAPQTQPAQQTRTARPELGETLDLAAYPKADVADPFTGDTSGQYTTHQPFPDVEAAPEVAVGGGKFSGSGSAPFFGLMTGSAALTSDQAVVAVTFGAFDGTGKEEDSVFVGWILDKENYITGWYNNTRGTTGFDVRVGGRFRDVPVQIPFKMSPGDRLALVLSGDKIASYAEHQGTWQRLHTASIPGLLSTEEARRGYRYGFGLRGTSGTISIVRVEGRSVQN